MRTIRIKISELFEFEAQPAPTSPDIATVTVLVLKRFGFLPQPVLVQIEGDEVVIQHPEDSMKPIQGYHLIKPEDLSWQTSRMMQIPNADFLERTGSENLGARLWRLPPKSANTLHKHIRQEEFYFVLEGTGRLRVGDETLTVPKYGGVLVGPDQLRQVFNDTDAEALWLIIGAPEELAFLQGSKSKMDLSLIYPTDPTQLPKELAGVQWPPSDVSSPPNK